MVLLLLTDYLRPAKDICTLKGRLQREVPHKGLLRAAAAAEKFLLLTILSPDRRLREKH